MSIFAKISTAIGRALRASRRHRPDAAVVVFFSFGDALGKFMVATYSVGELLLLRASASLILLTPMIWRSRGAFPLLQRPGCSCCG